MASRGPLDFIGVALSYRRVYGEEATWAGLEKALAPYSLEQIFIVICRISVSLYNQTLPWNPQTQLCICKGIFGVEEFPRILEALKSLEAIMKRENDLSPILVFHEQQTLNLLKVALLLKTEDDIETIGSLAGIGKALLMITDLLEGEPGNLLSVKHEDPDYFEKWLSHILGNYLFKSDSANSYELARSHDLYLTDKEYLRGCGSYVDLIAVLKETTGLEPDSLWSLAFAMGSHWMTFSEQSIPDANMSIGITSYLMKNFNFDEKEIDQFFSLFAKGVRELQRTVCQLYTTESLRPLDVLPFAKWPLVVFDDRVYAISVPLLMQKLTTGLHYLYLDTRIEEDQRQRYLTYMGEVFEDYVHRLFNRIYPPISKRYLRLDELREDIATKYCDGLIVYEKGLVLIESKASLFALEARVGHDYTSIRDRLNDIYLDGARQLQATINILRQGFRDDRRTIPENIQWYIPVIVTLEQIPMNPLIYGEIRKMLTSNGLLIEHDVLQLQSINIDELEQIEAVLQGGISFRELFEDKISQEAEKEDSWANYLFRRRNKLPEMSNTHLDRSYKDLCDRALQYFGDRKNA
jgi:hypothetical protein